MPYLEENEWMLINEITYRAHYIYSIDELQSVFLDMIKFLVDYDAAIFARIKTDDGKLSFYAVQYRGMAKKTSKAWEEETLDSDYARWIIMSGKNHAFLESEMMSGKRLQESEIYKTVYAPCGLKYSIGICFVFKDTPLAMLRFYRKHDKHDFDIRDLFVLDQIHNHMAYRLSYEVNKGDTRYFWAKGLFMKICQEDHLTDKEAEIFSYAIKGLTNKDISVSMKISVSTVKKHLYSLYNKMGVKNRVQLLQYLPPSTNKRNYDDL